MKLRNTPLLIVAALTSSLSIAEIEIDLSGQLVVEASKYLDDYDGMVENHNPEANGARTFESHGREWFKNSVDLRLYVDADIDDIIPDATFHAELNGFVNPLGSGAESGYNSNESYTQRDLLREAYVDSEYNDWQLRIGKQQVVWGTADGMKLLDMMNPTDYTEMAQNQMEDSRIPVWMVSAETELENNTDLHVVLSEPRENVFSGLNRNINTDVRGNGERISEWGVGGIPVTYKDNIYKSHDEGQFTLMRGPTSITGSYDGFLNIVPDMGTIATRFGEAFSLHDPSDVDKLTLDGLNNAAFASSTFTVGEFLSGLDGSDFGTYSDTLADYVDPITGTKPYANGFGDLNFAAWVDNMMGPGTWANAVPYDDNGTPNDLSDDTQATGQYTIKGETALIAFFTSQYASNLFDITDGDSGSDFINPNSAFEYMGDTTFQTFDAFVNAKSQYAYDMPKSNEVDFAIRNKGIAKNGMNWQTAYAYGYDRNPIINLRWKNQNGETLTVNTADNNTLSLSGPNNEAYGGAAQQAALDALYLAVVDPTDAEVQAAIDSKAAILEFEETTTRIHSLGGAFDMAIETGALGTMVLRGEGLYQKDTHQPRVDFEKLSRGDLANSLVMAEVDKFKFVVGFDFTFLTNMFSSLQIIRDINLDYNEDDADFATMMLTNGFNTDGAVKYKEYYSLYFSKPFGESGQHRWNNMTMYEGGDGWWNWFTVGFGMTDEIEATFELNHYWGNPNTAFGQHQKSNNVQVGFKYNF